MKATRKPAAPASYFTARYTHLDGTLSHPLMQDTYATEAEAVDLARWYASREDAVNGCITRLDPNPDTTNPYGIETVVRVFEKEAATN